MLLSCVMGGVTAVNRNEHNEKILFFEKTLKCFIPQFAACFEPLDNSNIHALSAFPVWVVFIKKIILACYLVISIVFNNATRKLKECNFINF